MKNIAILTGGDSAEYDISILSANTVLQHLNPELFKGYIIHLKDDKFTVLIKKIKIEVDKSNFTFEVENKRISFDAIFMALHGSPAENGLIQPYFDNLNIPYTSCNAKVSALTFNKYECNKKLKELGFNCATSFLYKKENNIVEQEIIDRVKLPCFVKPNGAGSSFGISKVKKKEDLTKAINSALQHDNKVLIEQFIDGIEISCGVYTNQNNIQALPITEIVTENEFFDYQAKYEGKSQEITPARISKKLTIEVQKLTTDIYKAMELSGICRIDYIIMNEKPYILEINTIPGFTEESIIPQQVKSANLKLSVIFESCLVDSKE
ncbi:MAG: D-alanine--D-alanine ligase [Cryomorphaceae bacterium]|nr:D-alanine--D-alanine ligase [Cryomorphaceae bacterium]